MTVKMCNLCVKVVIGVFLMISLTHRSLALRVTDGYQQGTVYIDSLSGAASCKLGLMDKQNGTAYGFYNNTLNVTGWGILELHAHSTTINNTDIMFAAGFLEGVLTARQIYQNFVNLKSAMNINDAEKEKLIGFLAKQDYWLRSMIVKHPKSEDAFWRHISYIIAQFDGLYAGYKSVAESSWETDVFIVQLLNGMGDLLDLRHVVDPISRPNYRNMTRHELKLHLARTGHCSALIKLTPGFENLFMSHSSWFTYASTMRIYKHYHLRVNDKDTAVESMSFSSYPGFLESLDDFYLMDNKLVMLQTTNNIYNTSLYDLVTPQSVFAWQRVRVANMLAHSGQEWFSVVSKYNSGTYNNQYMVIDLNRVVLNNHVQDGALWIVEQIPGLVIGTDQTAILRTGYFPSYNVPFHEVIFNMSGYPDIVARQGPDFSYELAPRAKIFRRDQSNVVDLASMKDIMRYNDYQHDKYSEGDPCDSICCRGDLYSGGGSPFGCYDTKVADYKMAVEMASVIINGPTRSHHLKPFSWNGSYSDYSHVGLPETYNFDWVTTQPQL